MSRAESFVDQGELPSGNPLAQIIEQKIQENGPIPFDQYMSACAYGAKDSNGLFCAGFYNGNEVKIGRVDSFNENCKSVDFPTLPEITPLYGYAIAKQIIEMWRLMDFPTDFRIVEMGGGNGTLALDILNSLKLIAAEHDYPTNINDISRYVLVEQSPVLIRKQENTLQDFSERVDFIKASATDLPLTNITGVVISNELPDAFPMRKVRRKNGRIEEAFVSNGNSNYFEEKWKEPTIEVSEHISRYNPVIPEKPHPIGLESEKWMKGVSSMLEKGFVITIDYPHENMDKFPALFAADNKKIDLSDPQAYLKKSNVGVTDITGGVDFHMLSDVGTESGMRVEGNVNNSGFLFGLDIDHEFYKLCAQKQTAIGERKINEDYMINALDDKHFSVLVQSKGIKGPIKLSGVKYNFRGYVGCIDG